MQRLGIDIGGTSIKASLIAGDAETWHGRSLRYARPGRDALADTLARVLRPVLAQGGSIEYVGLCAPGVLAPDASSIAMSINVPGLVGTRFDELLGAAGIDVGALQAPPKVVTDAFAAATDASRVLNLAGRVLALSIGTGVGACVLDAGVPLIVSGQGPGHFGQIDVSLAAGSLAGVPIGPDGGRGTLEGYIGVPALRSRYGDDIESALASLTPDAVPCRALVRALRIAHALYRPQHVVLLGGVGIRLAHIAEGLRAAVSHELTSVARPDWTLRCGTTDLHAARGAAWLAGC
ncbi:MAG: ROK family protein [Phycisphaerales bacterium]